MNSAVAIQNADESLEPLRAIAHELRQPLGTIESIAYYLDLVLPRAETKLHEQVARVQRLVEQSNWILACGLQLVDNSPLAPVPTDLEELVTQSLASHLGPQDPRPRVELHGNLPLVQLDPARARALIENLFAFTCLLGAPSHRILIRTAAPEAGGAALEVVVAGVDYASETALGAGASLCMESARKIAAQHNGTFECTLRGEEGVSMRLVIP